MDHVSAIIIFIYNGASNKPAIYFYPMIAIKLLLKLYTMTEKELYKNDYCGEITTLTINNLDLYYVKLVGTYFSNRNVVCLTKSEAICIAIEIFRKENILSDQECNFLIDKLKKVGII